MPGVKYMQFLIMNPIFRSKITNSGNQGQKHGKAQSYLFLSFEDGQSISLSSSVNDYVVSGSFTLESPTIVTGFLDEYFYYYYNPVFNSWDV